MGHLTGILEQPESRSNSSQALHDYLEIIETESAKRGGTGLDPLMAARDKFREKNHMEDNRMSEKKAADKKELIPTPEDQAKITRENAKRWSRARSRS